MYGLKNKSGQKDKGVIRGAGTGTSDDIKKTVPSGSYIMPKDSTDAIGEENLARLGQPTDVNLSNGEFQLSPDQVHSVGVQALDEMKGQTHAPVDQPQLGIKRGADKPELFFANGGVVDDNFIKPIVGKSPQQSNANRNFGQNMIAPDFIQANKGRSLNANTIPPRIAEQTSSPIQPKVVKQSVNPSPTKAPQNTPSQNSGFGAFAKNMIAPEHDDGSWNAVGGLMNTATGLGKAGVGAAGGLMGGLGEGTRSTAAWIGGAENPNAGNIVGPSFDFAGDGLKQARLGWNQMFGLTPKKEEQPQSALQPVDASAQSAAKGTAPTTDNKPAPPLAATLPDKTAPPNVQQQMNTAMYGQDTAQGQLQAPSNDPYKIQQKGNSFSYANAGAAAQARNNGVPELQNSSGVGGIRRANDPKGVANFMSNTREMGASQEQIDRAVQQSLNSNQGFGIQYPSRPQRTDEQEAERKNVLRQISAPIQGARGMTTNQRSQLMEMQQGDDTRATTMYNTDANNATSQLNNTTNNAANIAQTGMREQGSNERAVLGENGQNMRYGMGLQQDREKFNREMSLTETKEGFGIRNAQRLEKLDEMYDKAETDEQRASIKQRRDRLTGAKDQSGKDRFMAVGGGQQWDDKAGGTLTQPQRLFDTQTQQFLDTSNQAQSQYQEGQIYHDPVSGQKRKYEKGQWVPV